MSKYSYMVQSQQAEIPAIAYGATAREATPLPIPYIIDGDRLVLPATGILDVLYEQEGLDERNLYIPLGNAASQQTVEVIFGSGLCNLNYHKRSLHIDGNEVDLSPADFSTLAIYGRNIDRVLPHDYVSEILWPHERRSGPFVHSRIINRTMRIRNLFDEYIPGMGNPASGVLRTIKGSGRMLCSEYLDGVLPAEKGKLGTAIQPTRSVTNEIVLSQPTAILNPQDSQVLIGGDTLVYDTVSRDLTGKGRAARLSEREAAILAPLVNKLGSFVTLTELAWEAWGEDLTNKRKTQIQTNITQIRQKFGKIDADLGSFETGPLLTVRGRGYVLLG